MKLRAAEELAALDPDSAILAILEVVGSSDDELRAGLRTALARAARSRRAATALSAELQLDKIGARPEVVAIDLLRAAGPALVSIGGGQTFAEIARRATSFRAR